MSISSIQSNIESAIPKALKIYYQENFNINELAKYTIDISQITNEKYIHLGIAGESEENIFVLSVVDDFDKQNRIQLAQSIAGNTDLILSKEQITGNSINIILECSDYSNCKGIIKNEMSSKISLIENKPFNYYITIDNMIMEFSIHSASEILNIWARGEIEIITKLEGVEFTKYDADNAFLANNSDSNEITFKVTGKKGDYINVGYNGYIWKTEGFTANYYLSSKLFKDGYAITAYLNRNYSKIYCYNFENFNMDGEKIFVTGITFGRSIEYELIRTEDYVREEEKFNIPNQIMDIDIIERYQTLCFSLPSDENETLYIFQIYSSNH